MVVEQTGQTGQAGQTGQGAQTGRTGDPRHRGKLYALKEDAAWEDRGTGFTFVLDSGSGRRLMFRDEASDEILHDRPIFSSETYQLQGEEDRESIIVWADPESELDWAISFQEPLGARTTFELLSGAKTEEVPSLLPVPEFRNLSQLARMLTYVPPDKREKLSSECMSPKFVEKLRQVFSAAEDRGKEEELILLWRIAKGIFLLSSQRLTERYLRQDIFEDVFGMLEYDDGLPPQQRIPHRLVLKVQVRFKQVLAFDDAEMASRIHLNYRLQYLRDIVLPRIMDDGTFASMSQMIQANTSAILGHLQKSDQLMEELFNQLRGKDVQSLLFLQDACRMAKMLAPGARQLLYEKMAKHGLFAALSGFLDLQSSRNAIVVPAMNEAYEPHHLVVEILLLLVLHDSSHLRKLLVPPAPPAADSKEAQIVSELSPESTSERNEAQCLLRALIRFMHEENDQGVQSQVADIIRSVMDITSLDGKDREAFLADFYDASGAMEHLMLPMRELESQVRLGLLACEPSAAFALQLVCDLLAFAILHHGYRAKTLVTKYGMAQQAAQLFAAPQRFLHLAPVRLMRAMVVTKDDAYHRILVKSGLFDGLLQILRQSLKPPALGGNLLVSSILELLQTLRVQNVKYILAHLCGDHCNELQELAPHCKALQALISQHKQNMETEANPPERRANNALRRSYTMVTASDERATVYAAGSNRASRSSGRRGRAGGSSSKHMGKLTCNSAQLESRVKPKKIEEEDFDDEEAEPFVGSLVDDDSNAAELSEPSDGNIKVSPEITSTDMPELLADETIEAHCSSASLHVDVDAQAVIAGDSSEHEANASGSKVLAVAEDSEFSAKSIPAADQAEVVGGAEVPPVEEAQLELLDPDGVGEEEPAADMGRSNGTSRLLSHAAKRARTGAVLLNPAPVFA